MARIVVTSPSFSRHPVLRQELAAYFPVCRFRQDEGVLDPDALADFVGDADGAVIGLEPVDDRLLSRLPNLRIVAKYGVGLDNIDLDACRTHGVAIGWTGGVNARSVAEMTLCFMLGMCRNIFRTATSLRSGTWNKRGGMQLSGKTVGIVGVGYAGQEVIRLLAPFGCRVLGNDIVDRSEFCGQWGVTPVDKDELFATSDIVSLHVPLTALTHRLINATTLAQFKRGAFLINTCRGPVVDQAALHAALANGTLGGAALDVYDPEPPTDPEFLGLPGLIATPHIGGNADEAILAMGRSAIGHLKDHFSGSGS